MGSRSADRYDRADTRPTRSRPRRAARRWRVSGGPSDPGPRADDGQRVLPVKAAVMRIAVSRSTFRRPLAADGLTQLEWLERCASELDADGVLADLADFPRTDTEYTAQLRKVAVY